MPTRTWQWERNGTPISGATASTYTLVSADAGADITVVQTETNTAGTASAESAPTAVPVPLILDSLSAGAAYSTRLIRTEYGVSSPCVEVRESGGNTLANIPFKLYAFRDHPYWIDEDALLAHCGSNSGFIRTWYDQSGNARHVTQTTTAAQPRIVNAGVLEAKGGFPAVYFDGLMGLIRSTDIGIYSSGVASVFAVAAQDVADEGWIWNEGSTADFLNYSGGTSAANAVGFSCDYGSGMTVILAASPPAVASATSANLAALAWRDTGTEQQCFSSTTGGTARAYATRVARSNNLFGIGTDARTQDGAIRWIGHLSELILFPANFDNATLNSVRSNQGGAYGITVNPI